MSHLVQQFDFDGVMCSLGFSASFCRYLRYFEAVWFVNCVQYFDKTSRVSKIVF